MKLQTPFQIRNPSTVDLFELISSSQYVVTHSAIELWVSCFNFSVKAEEVNKLS